MARFESVWPRTERRLPQAPVAAPADRRKAPPRLRKPSSGNDRRDQLVAVTARYALPLTSHFRGDEMSTDSNASARSCSQVSQRMRLYRKRRRQGLQSVRILLPVTDIDYFTREVLTERQRQRPDALETGLAGLIQQILDEIRDARASVTGNDAVTNY